jgi:hypothetical protein
MPPLGFLVKDEADLRDLQGRLIPLLSEAGLVEVQAWVDPTLLQRLHDDVNELAALAGRPGWHGVTTTTSTPSRTPGCAT